MKTISKVGYDDKEARKTKYSNIKYKYKNLGQNLSKIFMGDKFSSLSTPKMVVEQQKKCISSSLSSYFLAFLVKNTNFFHYHYQTIHYW